MASVVPRLRPFSFEIRNSNGSVFSQKLPQTPRLCDSVRRGFLLHLLWWNRVAVNRVNPPCIQREQGLIVMPKENDLEGAQDQGGKHGGQKGMPKPVPKPGSGTSDQGILRDQRGHEQPRDKQRAAVKCGQEITKIAWHSVEAWDGEGTSARTATLS